MRITAQPTCKSCRIYADIMRKQIIINRIVLSLATGGVLYLMSRCSVIPRAIIAACGAAAVARLYKRQTKNAPIYRGILVASATMAIISRCVTVGSVNIIGPVNIIWS